MSKLNISYIIDIQGPGSVQFINQLFCSVQSLKNNKRPEDEIDLYILYANSPAEVVAKLNNFNESGFKVILENIPQTELQRLQQFSKHNPQGMVRAWSGIVYARIFLPLYLKKYNLDKILYLDIDTLIRGSLHELYETPLEDNYYGMVMGIVPEYGYNSGVMIMNFEKFYSLSEDETKLLWTSLDEHMKKYARNYFCPDQTVINRFFSNSIKPLDFKYNYPPCPGNMGSDYDMLMNKAIIWHFYNQQVKPLKFDDQGLALVEWNKVLNSIVI